MRCLLATWDWYSYARADLDLSRYRALRFALIQCSDGRPLS